MSPKLKAALKKAIGFVKLNPFLCAILLLSFFLLFFNLGSRILSGDDANYSLLAKNILTYGFPRMFDGSFLVGFDYQIGPNYAYMMNTWLGEYVIAFSYLLFGVSNFTSRLLPAIFGFLTLILLYFFALKITDKKHIAVLSVFFLAVTPVFYYLSRSANYYALACFLILAVLYSYLLVVGKDSKRAAGIYFAISSILLFYTQVQMFFFTLLSIFAYFLLFHRRLWKRFILPLVFIFLFTFPYFLFWVFGSNVLSRGVPESFSLLRPLSALCISFFYYFVLVFPLVLAFFVPSVLFSKKKVNANYFFILFFIIAIAFLNVAFDNLGTPGVRRLFIPTLPLFAILLASLTWKVKKWSKPAALILILVLVFSNTLHIIPFSFFKPVLSGVMTSNISKDSVTSFVHKSLKWRSPIYEYLYELRGDYISPNDDILSLIKSGANPDDVYFTNADVPIIYFYTGHRPLMNPEKTSINFRKMSTDFVKQSKIDWIIVRNLNRADFEEFINNNIDLSKYETITIAQNDEPWVDFPSPINRRWKTDRAGEIVVYHLRE